MYGRVYAYFRGFFPVIQDRLVSPVFGSSASRSLRLLGLALLVQFVGCKQ